MSSSHPASGSVAVRKEDLNYEGRVRVEKRTDELVDSYSAYMTAHPEIQPLLHDVMQHVLVHKPEQPLMAMREFVAARVAADRGEE